MIQFISLILSNHIFKHIVNTPPPGLFCHHADSYSNLWGEGLICFPLCASNFSSFLCPLVASLSYPGCCPFHPGDITPSLPSAPWQSPDSLKNLSVPTMLLLPPSISILTESSSQHSSWSRSVKNCHGRESWQRKLLEVPCHNQSFSEKKRSVAKESWQEFSEKRLKMEWSWQEKRGVLTKEDKEILQEVAVLEKGCRIEEPMAETPVLFSLFCTNQRKWFLPHP